MKYFILALALLVSNHAAADEASRKARIIKIVEAQGLLQSFEQQREQMKNGAAESGKAMVYKILEEAGISDPSKFPEVEQVFLRHMERCANMYTPQEFVDTWLRFYGTDLSEPDLDKILAFYQSPVGKREVAASQKALAGFSQAMAAESQKRMEASIQQMMQDIKTTFAAVEARIKAEAKR